MFLDEALKTMRMGLVSQCMMLEEVRRREVFKVMGEYPPMQDHLADCTLNETPDLEWDVEDCLTYLEYLHNGFRQAFLHGQLATKKGLDKDFDVAIIADMLWGGINHNYPDNLVNCAKEVNELIKKMKPKVAKQVNDYRLGWQRKVIQEIKNICEKYEVDFPIYDEYTIQEGYMMEWLKGIYEDIPTK